MKNNALKNMFKGLLVIAIYYIMSVYQGLPFVLFGIDTEKISIVVKSIYLTCYELLMILIIYSIYKTLLQEKWEDFKKNHIQYFNKYFKYWFLLLGLMMISNMIIMFITKDTSGAQNQNEVINLFKKAPIYTYLSAVVFAPIVEELVFRQSIRYIIPKNNILYIIVSGLIFGGMHVLGSTNLTEFIYIIPYSLPGMIFAYVLTKSDNIFTTTGLHFIHNGILMSIQTIMLIFG